MILYNVVSQRGLLLHFFVMLGMSLLYQKSCRCTTDNDQEFAGGLLSHAVQSHPDRHSVHQLLYRSANALVLSV